MATQKQMFTGETVLKEAVLAGPCTDSPLAHVLFSYPWGEPNTPLHDQLGPRSWQRDELLALEEHIRDNRFRVANGLTPRVFRLSHCHGRGTGKTALLTWILLWMMSTRLGSTTIVTANTETQLETRTWAELGKWYSLSVFGHWFEKGALYLRPQKDLQHNLKKDLGVDSAYYYAQAQMWRKEAPDSFAGVHNPHGLLLIFDEASGIPDGIWTVSEGFFTEPVLDRYWIVASNGRRNTGRFFETHHADRDRWRHKSIDNRTVEGVDHAEAEAIVTKYGEDSDEARTEVRGLFPRQGDNQFISREAVDLAVARPVVADPGAPLVIGVDVARYGNDKSVIAFRRGRDARTIPMRDYPKYSTTQLAHAVFEAVEELDPDAVVVDGTGVGGGVVDRLREMGVKVREVNFGEKAENPKYKDLRTELWWKMGEWVETGSLPADKDLYTDLVNPEKEILDDGRIKLESKDDMKARGLASPDHGDALACTFAAKVAHADSKLGRKRKKKRVAKGMDYKIFRG